METISKVFRSSQEVFGAGSKNSRPKMALIRDLCGISAMATLALYSLCAREPNIFPSMQTLAKNMKVSPSTAKRAVRELQRAGYLRVTHRTHQTNLFTITVTSDPSERSPMTLHQFTQEPPEQVTHDPLSRSPMTPPQVTHDPPPRSPVTPQVAKEVFKVRSKERERERTLSPGNHSLKETLTCPKCEHTWPKDYGPVCHTCRMDIGTIQRRMDEGKRIDKNREISYEERLAEIRAISREIKAREQAKKQSKAKPPVQEPQAEEPKESLEEVEAEHQSIRQFLFDETGKPYDEAILKHLAQGKDGGKP